MEVGDKLNPQRSYRKGFALKALHQHIIKTNNPSTIGPDELLTVRFPDLKENQVIIPSTMKLTFNITLAGTDVNRTLVRNLGRNIIRKLVVKLEGNEIISIDDYDVLYSYYDCWKCTNERLNSVFQGIIEAEGQTENAIKHRINSGDKADVANDITVAAIYDNRFCIPLDFEILESSLPLYQLDVRTAKSVQTFDFSTLYTSIPHDLLKSRISNLVHNAFRKKDGSVRYTHIKLTRAKGYFTRDINGGGDNMFTADSICKMIEFLIDNIFVQFGGRLFRQVIGIPMGTNCAPLLADLFLYSYENEFLDDMIRSGHRRLARSFNLCYRYIDDLIVFNNKKFLDYLKEIYPSQLTVEKANKSDHLADYLDLTFIIDSGGKLSTRLYDRRDDFDFHIVNFPFLSSNIPSGPSYGVYISQLIRYARCCSHYDDFRYRHKCLVDRLLSQGYKALRLEKSFKKFYGRYQDLIEKYRRSVNAMVSDSFPGQFLFNM